MLNKETTTQKHCQARRLQLPTNNDSFLETIDKVIQVHQVHFQKYLSSIFALSCAQVCCALCTVLRSTNILKYPLDTWQLCLDEKHAILDIVKSN